MAQKFYAWSDAGDARAVAPLEDALEDLRTPLLPFDPEAAAPGEPAALVIFLSPRLLRSAGDRLGATVESWTGPVVPVALTRRIPGPPPPVAVLSWIEAEAEPIETVAGRIALSARTSPRWLLAWQETRAAAERNRGEDAVALLGPAELERAEDTVRNRPRDLLPEVPAEVLGLLHESRKAIDRRRRLRFALALGAVLVLFGIAAVALLQRHSATVAEANAKRAITRSQADRLSRLAQQDLDSDPDLPVLLARRAYRLEPGPQTWESLRLALDAGPWHRSYRLRTAPVRLAASTHSPLVAVVGSDGSVDLLDSRTGRWLAGAGRPPGTRGTPVVASSADGRRLALAYDGGLVQVRRLDRAFRVVWSGRLPGLGESSSLSIAWEPDGRHLVTAWSSHPAVLVDLPSRHPQAIRGGGVSAPAAVATSHGLVALADKHRIAILRASSMRPCWSEARKSPEDLALVFDRRGSTLVVARESSFDLQVPVPARCGAPPTRQPETQALVSGEGTAAAPLGGGGVAIASPGGRVVLVAPPAIYPAGRFLAHVSDLTGMGVAAGGSLVTVGADRWMRVWQPPRAPAYPLGPAPELAFNESFARSDNRSTWRPMIASDESGAAMLGGFASGSIAVLRTTHLGDPVRSFFFAIASSIRPAATSPCAVLTFNGTAALFRCAGDKLHPVWTHTYTDSASTLFQTALSRDARTVAVAGLDTVDVTRVPNGLSHSFDVAELKALDFDRRDDLFAISGDGTILEAAVDGSSRRVGVPLGGCRLVLPFDARTAADNDEDIAVDTSAPRI